MKRFWLVLLSLGLVMAFSVSAFAVDVKVSAEYYAAGAYLNKTAVESGTWGENWDYPSTAFFFQRLRVGTDFVVSPCLKLVTRFDAMERIWGGARSGGYGGATDPYTPPEMWSDSWSAGNRNENENIAFDIVYVAYTSPIGLFEVGYMPDYDFGTIFANKGEKLYNGQIKYFIQKGNFIGFLGYSKVIEKNLSYIASTYPATDVDYDSYRIAGIYKFKQGEAGALFLFDRNALYKGGYSPYSGLLGPYGNFLQNVYVIDPYVKAKIGPVNLQAELLYYFGDAAKWEGYGGSSYSPNVSISALSVFVDATANFGMFNVGGTFAYLSGDDPNTDDKVEGSGMTHGNVNTGGPNYNPCLILFNQDTLGYWAGNIYGHSGSVVNAEMGNAWFFQGRVGVAPTPQWDVQLALSYALADKKPSWGPGEFPGGTYGTEIDLTGTYKITNNLSYMLGVGYLFTGDLFKGHDFPGSGTTVDDDYILINKLTLSF